MIRPPIYTEKTSCQDCYKCVRRCPVKAIVLEEGSALVKEELCIYCGACVEVCPAQAKKVRSDLERARELVRRRPVAVSLSPSFFAEYSEPDTLLDFFAGLGMEVFSETALGAEYLNRETESWIKKNPGSWITSSCPAVVEYIHLYQPELKTQLLPQASPMVIHGRLLKERYSGTAVIFLGPCIAKKKEADRNPQAVDLALTFQEAEEWMLREKEVLSAKHRPVERAKKACLYPMEGGMIQSLPGNREPGEALALSGMDRILEQLGSGTEEIPLLECLACAGGCINGPGVKSKGKILEKQKRLFRLNRERGHRLQLDFSPDTALTGALPIPVVESRFTPEEVEEQLILLDKKESSQRLNCGGCGYPTCRDFALSMLQGKSEREMCVGNMRKLAQKKVDSLIRSLPIGVVMVDRELRIQELNGPFLGFFSQADTEDHEEINRKTRGLPVKGFVPVEKFFHSVLDEWGNQVVKLSHQGRVFQAIFFTVEQDRLAGAVFRDITEPTIHRETIVSKAREVIRKNLESVQQMASLMGENAAETEIILSSVIEALDPGETLS